MTNTATSDQSMSNSVLKFTSEKSIEIMVHSLIPINLQGPTITAAEQAMSH